MVNSFKLGPSSLTGSVASIISQFFARKKTENEKCKIDRCYQCIKTCDVKNTPYCITKALINAVKGNIKEGLVFCGSNVEKVKEIVSVKTLMNELVCEL